MKKKVLVLALCLFAVCGVAWGIESPISTDGREGNEERVEWKAGVQVNGILGGFDQKRGRGHDSKIRSGFGVGGGAVGQIVFSSHWLVRTSLNLNYTDYPVWLNFEHDEMQGWRDCDYRSLSLSVPVMGGYRFELTEWADFAVMTGVAPSWIVSDKLKYSGKAYKENGWDADTVFRKFNLHYTLGFSIEMFDRFMVSGIGYFGLLNLGRDEVFGYRWNSTARFEFSIGYLLGNSRSKWDKRNNF